MKNQYLLKFSILMLLTINILTACSIGTSRVTLPDLSDVNLSSAENTLLELNLIPFYITKYDDNVPKGKVIDTIPEAYSKVDAFSRVQLIVSDGPRELISTLAILSPMGSASGWLEMVFDGKPKIIEGILEIDLTITINLTEDDIERLRLQWTDIDNDGFGDGVFKVMDGFEESLRLPLTLQYETLIIYSGIPQTVKLRIPLKSLQLQTVYNLEFYLNYERYRPNRKLENSFIRGTIRLDW
jgi:hypothetical protein